MTFSTPSVVIIFIVEFQDKYGAITSFTEKQTDLVMVNICPLNYINDFLLQFKDTLDILLPPFPTM